MTHDFKGALEDFEAFVEYGLRPMLDDATRYITVTGEDIDVSTVETIRAALSAPLPQQVPERREALEWLNTAADFLPSHMQKHYETIRATLFCTACAAAPYQEPPSSIDRLYGVCTEIWHNSDAYDNDMPEVRACEEILKNKGD